MHNIRVAKLSFVWGKMRTAAWETAPQIVLRNCSKEAEGKISEHVISVKIYLHATYFSKILLSTSVIKFEMSF